MQELVVAEELLNNEGQVDLKKGKKIGEWSNLDVRELNEEKNKK
jgi:hypothetical protein